MEFLGIEPILAICRVLAINRRCPAPPEEIWVSFKAILEYYCSVDNRHMSRLEDYNYHKMSSHVR